MTVLTALKLFEYDFWKDWLKFYNKMDVPIRMTEAAVQRCS